MTHPISRAELIHAGAPFTVECFRTPRPSPRHPFTVEMNLLRQMDGHRVEIRPGRTFRDATFVDWTERNILGNPHVHHGLLAGAAEGSHGRSDLARIVELADPEAAEALRRDLPPALEEGFTLKHGGKGYPQEDPMFVAPYALDVDALLYGAALHGDQGAVEHYLAMGADPLRRTFDGDCAARVGIAHGVVGPFTDHLDARDAQGQTGVHALARTRNNEPLYDAVSRGADLDWVDHAGVSVASLVVGPGELAVLRKAAAEYRSGQLEAVLPPAQDWAPSADGGKELGERMHGQEGALEQPARTRRAGLRL